ncbi:MAG: archaetidylserine decarboxylase, partial [Alicyclobacillus sp.]|nr:archaetidylserine decarboxylase [Alicyclobacillus sp.]
MRRTLHRWLLTLFPQRLFTACLGRLARARCSRRLIPLYARWYQIDAREADLPLASYPTLLDFFCRGLAKGARPLAASGVVSPVDGTVSELGKLDNGQLLQAKGCAYSLAALLADTAAAERYEGGHYVTLYLSPRDYHRIHMPVDGRLTAWRYVPGRLFPVNAWG